MMLCKGREACEELGPGQVAKPHIKSVRAGDRLCQGRSQNDMNSPMKNPCRTAQIANHGMHPDCICQCFLARISRTKSDAPVIQQIEADIGASSLQLPLPLLLCVGLLRIPLCYVAPAWHEALRHLPHKLQTVQYIIISTSLHHVTLHDCASNALCPD